MDGLGDYQHLKQKSKVSKDFEDNRSLEKKGWRKSRRWKWVEQEH